MVTYREATIEDAYLMAPNLREADVMETRAVGHEDPLDALLASVKVQGSRFVAVDDTDEPFIIFGVAQGPNPIVGYGWMMATPKIKKHWVRVLRDTEEWLQINGEPHELITNIVHADNKLHIRWLKWSGFYFLREVIVNDELFYEFARIKKD